MLQALKSLFASEAPTDYQSLIRQGALVLDVRTPAEYRSGHIKGSVNIPLDQLGQSLAKITASKPVITCCASGMRSASAKQLLQAKGYNVVNGGGWYELSRKLQLAS